MNRELSERRKQLRKPGSASVMKYYNSSYKPPIFNQFVILPDLKFQRKNPVETVFYMLSPFSMNVQILSTADIEQ